MLVKMKQKLQKNKITQQNKVTFNANPCRQTSNLTQIDDQPINILRFSKRSPKYLRSRNNSNSKKEPWVSLHKQQQTQIQNEIFLNWVSLKYHFFGYYHRPRESAADRCFETAAASSRCSFCWDSIPVSLDMIFWMSPLFSLMAIDASLCDAEYLQWGDCLVINNVSDAGK